MSVELLDDNWKVILSLLDNTSIVTLKFVNFHLHKLINKQIPSLHYDLEDIVYHDQYSLFESYIKPLIGIPKYSELLVNRLSYLAGYCDPIKYMTKFRHIYFSPQICLLGIYMRGDEKWLEYLVEYEESRSKELLSSSSIYSRLLHDDSMALRARSIEFTKHLKYSFTPRSIDIACGYVKSKYPCIEDIDKKFNIKPQSDIYTYMSYLYTNYESLRSFIGISAIKYDHKLLEHIMKLGYELYSDMFPLACEHDNLETVKYMWEHGLTTDRQVVITSVEIYNYLKSKHNIRINEYRCAVFAFLSNDYEEFIRNQHSYGVKLNSHIFMEIVEVGKEELTRSKIKLLLELDYLPPPNFIIL